MAPAAWHLTGIFGAATSEPTGMPVVLGLAGLVLGAVLGSFVALVADRWPKGENFVTARSGCRACGRTLQPAELVPIISFVLQRGHCRSCGGPIPPMLLIAEIAGGVIGAAVAVQAPGLADGVTIALFCLALLQLALLDAQHFWLPNALTLPLAAAGLAAGFAGLGPQVSFESRALGAMFGYVALEALRIGYRHLRGRDGLGGGDPKLFGAIGAWLGAPALPAIALAAATIGLAWAGLLAARGRAVDKSTPLPLGTALAIAAIAWTLIPGLYLAADGAG